MNSVHYLRDKIAVVGWSCRLPGASSVNQLWSLLLEGRCAVSSVPEDRFSLPRFGHPKRQERGKSYTWAAGVLDDLWGFDPSVFGVSPREAVQMDPQQRLLLQMTWEALEDAGITPSSIAGTDVGVFVGGSQSDYGQMFFADYAVADSQFATGTALAILSNRISYAFDLRGPSLTIDTACSSSLVALHHAAEALRSGRIDTAIVAGINVIASPAAFIAFSQASMLSPTGLCHAFSDDADGFVRAEGGAVLVLRHAAHAKASRNPVHGLILASDVNSDGRTNGISLPSLEAQEHLLERVYSRSGIEPDRLAFVEAHGTGTPAGDPIEATALGRALGPHRNSPLPIGSIKTNIGHLEPASGIAGLMKAMLALNHGILPKSLHFSRPNRNIDFEKLNLSVCKDSLLLPVAGQRCAGINSFGFGGTNAHVIVEAGKKLPAQGADGGHVNRYFFLSAESKPALTELSAVYADRVSEHSERHTTTLASAIAHRREQMSQRLVIASSDSNAVGEALRAYAAGAEHDLLTSGTVAGDDIPVAFVYSGNGSQWVGMGCAAYHHNADFREHFDEVSRLFEALAGWSLHDAMIADDLEQRLPQSSVAQPLIFAIQSAATAALRARGLQPAAVLGHSVGEVAAAEAAGILDLRTAVKVIFYRSKRQELARFGGRMAAVLAPAETVAAMIETLPGLELAAINSPRGVTIAGGTEALAEFKRIAADRRIAVLELELDYPFHTRLMEPVRQPLLADLKAISPHDAKIPFVSTVTGAVMPGARLDSNYWWHNVREPVRFSDSVRNAAKLGARYFVEIGPRGTLLKHISDSLEGEGVSFAKLSVLERKDGEVDPFDRALSKALVDGAQIDIGAIFGSDPGPGVPLPSYPWQQTHYRFTQSSEAVGTEPDHHPFLGTRLTADMLEWRAHIDINLFPELADHKVGDQIIFPGTGFLEIGIAAAQKWLKAEQVVIADCEILRPLDLTSGETREVMTRVSAGSATVEIFSRPRLSQAGWLLHSRAKILHANPGDASRAPAIPAEGRTLEGRELYRIASASGLNYGPAFGLVDHATLHNDRFVSVELASSTATTPFLLDPVRLDACVHSMITQFPELRAEQRGVTFIPVRVDESVVFRPHGVPARALMEILSKSERSVLANFYIYDADGALISLLRGARCQALPIKRARAIETSAFVERSVPVDGAVLGETGVAATPDSILTQARAAGVAVPDSATPEGAALLLEGWATAAAYEIARGLAENGRIDVARLVDAERLPEELRNWLTHILISLEGAELASEERQGVWRINSRVSLPSSASIVKALRIEHPSRAGELLIAGAITGLAKQVASDRAIVSTAIVSPAVLDFHDHADASVRTGSDALWAVLKSAKGLWRHDRALRILQVGYSPLAEMLADHGSGLTRLTLLEPSRRQFDRAQMKLAANANVKLIDGSSADKLGMYDLIVSVGGLHRLPPEIGMDRLRTCLAPHGVLAAIEPGPSLFNDLVFGLDPAWFGGGLPDFPVSGQRAGDQWIAELKRAAFADPGFHALASDGDAALIVAAAGAGSRSVSAEADDEAPLRGKTVLVAGPADLADGLSEDGIRVVRATADLADYESIAPDVVVLEASAFRTDDPADELAERCLEIKACAERMTDAPAQLWLIFSGARAGAAPVNPVETGAWAFSRTLANEFPKIDVRRIDVSPALERENALRQIREVLHSGTDETEIHLEAGAIRAVRVQELGRQSHRKQARPAAASLVRQQRSSARLAWRPSERREIGADEIEIAVEATGVNFRDLMWTLGLLPDDMLENGYTGPGLGLECAGSVTRTGKLVKKLRVGDRVLAMAPSAFSTHVVVSASRAGKIPDAMSVTSATTIPVAFLTAHYSLVTLAKLKRQEWVLIHGAAGGVGLAAIQIATSRRAKVIATAGSPAKRALLRALGVRHVLDSRSLNIVDEVRAIAGAGVDVVLNSLAGEAMERSVACLAPFGRFVELGKRDYVSNTHIGLRPFRRNLSYFGVDVDQLVGKQRSLGERAFAEIMRGFAKETFNPLPHSVFTAADVSDAFDLMQRSSHIGKIVVLPPPLDTVHAATKSFSVSATGTHVITGAFGGFGLETAKWLADRGARHLVMVGRRGPSTPDAHAVLADFAVRGVKVLTQACDVSDLASVSALFETIRKSMPPVSGVMHAAMVLDDAVIPNLDRERFLRVLQPKVLGAEHLDAATRGLALDYFVLYSSVTTTMGNPGQGNYVAANAYMEGLARRRRKAGLPALAIGWGPITDVGVLARNETLQANLKKITGVSGMRAREALELMEQALMHGSGHADAAVITISPSDGGFSADRLPVLRSPTYSAMTRRGAQSEGEGSQIDLKTLIADEGIDTARRKVSDVIVIQLARVLHAREEDISRLRPLADIGLDSLMALELVGNLESIFAIQIPLSTSAGTLTVTGVADAILANIDSSLDSTEAAVSKLAEQHLQTVPIADLGAVKDMIEDESRKIGRVIS